VRCRFGSGATRAATDNSGLVQARASSPLCRGLRVGTESGFDFAYKSNLKNLGIYEQSLIDPRGAATRHWGFFIALFLVVAGGLVGIGLGVIALAHRAF
jgi:hypothetical protein